MIIEKTRFGTIDIEEEKIITMKRSLPGLPGRKRFALLDRKESHPFYWFQAVDDPSLAFALVNPYLFMPDYVFDTKPVLKEVEWGLEGEEDVHVFVIVNATYGAPEKITANLMAPLLLNTNRFEAFQLVMADSQYSHKHLIFDKDN